MHKKQEILAVGDSNLRHLQYKISIDKKLSKLPLNIDAVSGRRIGDINLRDIERFARFRYIIIMVGNNDLGNFRQRRAVDPRTVACNLIAVAEILMERGCRVRVIKLLPRTDVAPHLIVNGNQVLKRHLGRNLFCQMTIYRSKFNHGGGYHPVPKGALDLLRGLYKACQTFGFNWNSETQSKQVVRVRTIEKWNLTKNF